MVLGRIFVSVMPADIYIRPQETSRGEILARIGYTPEPDWDNDEEWPQEAQDYAEQLARDLPSFLTRDFT
jgi:hypothetical protein